jgi:hypothetical protein
MNRFKIYILFNLMLFAVVFNLQNRIAYASGEPWGLAPRNDNPISPYVQEPSVLSPTSRAFGYDAAFGTTGPSKFFLNTPGTIVNLAGPTGSDFFTGGTFGPNGKWYCVLYTAHSFLTCDTSTGASTVIGNLGAISGAAVGLTWDITTSTMYLLTTSPNNLYTVNISTGAATLVAPISGIPLIIDGAVSNGGILYAIELGGSGSFGRINKTTGVWTTVGPLGVTASFAQGCGFDRGDGTLYWAAYTSSGALRKIDTTTGASTLIGAFASGAEIDGFMVPSSNAPPLQPLCEQFTSTTFPPTGWTITGGTFWLRSALSAFGQGVGSAYFNMWTAPTGDNEDLKTLTFLPTTNGGGILVVDMAYSPYPTNPPFAQDSLIIMASTNGGTTYARVASLGPLQLQTVPSGSSQYVPAPGDWVKRSYVLPVGTNKVDFYGKSQFGNDLYIDSTCVNDNMVGISHNGTGVPKIYSLSQNYPNPFNPSTQISFGLPKSGNVKLVVYDILGREVKTLVNDFRNAGTYNISFDASSLASGIYFYSIKANDFTQTKKMLLVK